jgi:preprotein translocase subunit SecA
MEEFSEQQIQEHFQKLPKVLQDAITSAEIEKHLREIADTYKLHLDQWNELENEVMLALMGMRPAKDLKDSIVHNVGIEETLAISLAADISRVVFDPVREELERHLEHPDAQAKQESGIEKLTAQEIASNKVSPAPLAPLPTAPETKAVRAPISEVYKPGETSSTRKDIVNDPYRVPPV